MSNSANYSPGPVGNNGRNPNVLFADVWTGTFGPTVTTLIDGIITLIPSNYSFPQRITTIKRFDKIAYAAGTAGVYTVNFSAVTPVIGNRYELTVYGGSAITPFTYTFITLATTTNPNDLAAAFNTAIANSLQSAYLTSTVATSTITITEANALTGGFTITSLGSSPVVTTSTANVLPFGTVAQVALYKPSITSGTFNLYQWAIDADQPNFEGTGQKTLVPTLIQIWMDTGSTNYATADTQLLQYGDDGTFWAASYSVLQMQAMLNIPK